jgi:hypothetical protein
MMVNGRRIEHFHSTVIDSGTTYTYFPHTQYVALREAVEDACQDNKCNARKSGECWEAPSGLDAFPVVDFIFESVKTLWRPEEYMYRKGTSAKWCYGFHDDGARTTTTLGASWMLYKEVVFDLKGRRIGIAPAACPEYKQRPEHFVDKNDPRPSIVRKVESVGSSIGASIRERFTSRHYFVLGVVLAVLAVTVLAMACILNCWWDDLEQLPDMIKDTQGQRRRDKDRPKPNLVGVKAASLDEVGEQTGGTDNPEDGDSEDLLLKQ